MGLKLRDPEPWGDLHWGGGWPWISDPREFLISHSHHVNHPIPQKMARPRLWLGSNDQALRTSHRGLPGGHMQQTCPDGLQSQREPPGQEGHSEVGCVLVCSPLSSS